MLETRRKGKVLRECPVDCKEAPFL